MRPEMYSGLGEALFSIGVMLDRNVRAEEEREFRRAIMEEAHQKSIELERLRHEHARGLAELQSKQRREEEASKKEHEWRKLRSAFAAAGIPAEAIGELESRFFGKEKSEPAGWDHISGELAKRGIGQDVLEEMGGAIKDKGAGWGTIREQLRGAGYQDDVLGEMDAALGQGQKSRSALDSLTPEQRSMVAKALGADPHAFEKSRAEIDKAAADARYRNAAARNLEELPSPRERRDDGADNAADLKDKTEWLRQTGRKIDALQREIAKLNERLYDPLTNKSAKEDIRKRIDSLTEERERLSELMDEVSAAQPAEWRRLIKAARPEKQPAADRPKASQRGASRDDPIPVDSPDQLKNIAPGTWIKIRFRGVDRVIQYYPK